MLYFVSVEHVVLNEEGDPFEDVASLYVCVEGMSKFELGPQIDLRVIQRKRINGTIIIELGQFDNDAFSPRDGVIQTNCFQSTKPLYLICDDFDNENRAEVSTAVYLLGFPSISFGQLSMSGVRECVESFMPLVRGGILAGIQGADMVVDCPSHQGNSGGIVVALCDTQYKVVGLINEAVCFVEELYSAQHKKHMMQKRYENTGLTLVRRMDGSLIGDRALVTEGRTLL